MKISTEKKIYVYPSREYIRWTRFNAKFRLMPRLNILIHKWENTILYLIFVGEFNINGTFEKTDCFVYEDGLIFQLRKCVMT
jgi:hypothetical protein